MELLVLLELIEKYEIQASLLMWRRFDDLAEMLKTLTTDNHVFAQNLTTRLKSDCMFLIVASSKVVRT